MQFLSDKILDFLEPAELERLFRGYFSSLIKESTDTINNNNETKITDLTINNNKETRITDIPINNQQKEPSKIADITNITNNTNNQQKDPLKISQIVGDKSFVLQFVDQREIQRKRIQFRTTKISNHRTNVSLQNHPWKMPETKSRSLMCSLWEVLLVSSSQKYRCFECDKLLESFTMYNSTSVETEQSKYPYKIYCKSCATKSKDVSVFLNLNLKKDDRDKLQLLHSQNYRCKICDTLVYPTVELDHKQPKAFGGSDKTTNLQNLCCECHRVKSLHESVMYGKDSYKTITSRIAEQLINNLKKIRE